MVWSMFITRRISKQEPSSIIFDDEHAEGDRQFFPSLAGPTRETALAASNFGENFFF